MIFCSNSQTQVIFSKAVLATPLSMPQTPVKHEVDEVLEEWCLNEWEVFSWFQFGKPEVLLGRAATAIPALLFIFCLPFDTAIMARSGMETLQEIELQLNCQLRETKAEKHRFESWGWEILAGKGPRENELYSWEVQENHFPGRGFNFLLHSGPSFPPSISAFEHQDMCHQLQSHFSTK